MNGNIVKSKTFWAGIAGVASGIGLIVSGDIPSGTQLIIGSIMGIFIRDGILTATGK